VSENRVGVVSADGWCVRYFGIRRQVSADSKLLETSFLPDFLPLDRGLVLLEMRQSRLMAAD